MSEILKAVLVLGIMGGALGLILAIASKVFYVEVDERIEEITDALPGANCGGCGFAGCSMCAASIVQGGPITACHSCSQDTISQIAEIMGVEDVEIEKEVAYVRCTGNNGSFDKFSYIGIDDCVAAAKVGGLGARSCSYGCVGMGSCIKSCKFDAISIVDGVAKVDKEKCTGCMACVSVCPKNLIVMIPYDSHTAIPCASEDIDKETAAACRKGCIGCGDCTANCPKGAVHVEGNLAVIDYEACVGCTACSYICPRRLIQND